MKENTQHFLHIMLYFFKKVQKCNWNAKKICTVYGEGAVTDWLCQKWCAKFCAGDFSLDDSPRSGRPVEIDSDQTETLIENNQQYAMREIADILKISKSIKLLLKMYLLFYGKKQMEFLAKPIIFNFVSIVYVLVNLIYYPTQCILKILILWKDYANFYFAL